MDGLECVQCLVQQEGGVVNQHVQVEVEGRVLSLISGGKGREGKGREGKGREGVENYITCTHYFIGRTTRTCFPYYNNNLTVRRCNNLHLLNTCQVVWYKF